MLISFFLSFIIKISTSLVSKSSIFVYIEVSLFFVNFVSSFFLYDLFIVIVIWCDYPLLYLID